jgi:membrane protein implicated in regulation of membrane protease activity
MATPRLMIMLFVATGLVVAAVVVLLTGSWWALAAALVVHAVATISVVWYTLRRASQSQDKPHPVTEARIEEERLEARGR